ncbi:MAG: ABC transporter substrate-binding protein [Deltaproteobacteria bacterium]|nr:ABC transporter substrate-binding protein [Deltaproteobacteria bacterium]
MRHIGAVLLSGMVVLFLHTLALPAPSIPQRIVSLVPNITEELYLLGVQDRVVGVTIYCQRPPEAQSKERVGAVVEVNVEKIVSLRPDLVIASPLTDHKQTQKLLDLGVRVKVFQPPQDFEDLCAEFLQLAHLVGREKEAQEIIKSSERELAHIKEMIKGLPTPRVFVQIGEKPLVAAGSDSFINDLVVCAGGVNIAHEVKTSVYSREEVVRKNPDIILIAKMGIAGEREKKTWMKYTTIKAVQSNAIYTVDPYRFCSPTPLSFVEQVNELVRLFHGTG